MDLPHAIYILDKFRWIKYLNVKAIIKMCLKKMDWFLKNYFGNLWGGPFGKLSTHLVYCPSPCPSEIAVFPVGHIGAWLKTLCSVCRRRVFKVSIKCVHPSKKIVLLESEYVLNCE